jgi:hypothetical protein
VLALAALAAGCGGSDGPPPEELVAQTAEQTAAVESFHLVVNVENVPTPPGGLGLSFVDGDIAVPDRMKARVGGTFSGVPISTDLVVVGDRHWLRIPLIGSWEEVDVSATVEQFLDPSEGVLRVVEGASDLSDEGSEEVGGVDTHHLSGTVPAEEVAELLAVEATAESVPVELWIGKDDLLLRRVRLTGPIGEGEGEDAVRTVELSAFGERVEIEPPVSS